MRGNYLKKFSGPTKSGLLAAHQLWLLGLVFLDYFPRAFCYTLFNVLHYQHLFLICFHSIMPSLFFILNELNIICLHIEDVISDYFFFSFFLLALGLLFIFHSEWESNGTVSSMDVMKWF